jgi:hypothetical protein
MKCQLIFGPVLLAIGCWCLYVGLRNDTTLLLSPYELEAMEREYKDIDTWEEREMTKSAEGSEAKNSSKAQYFEESRKELDEKWGAARKKRRNTYLIGGGGSAGVGALMVLFGCIAAGRAAHKRKERAHERESTHHHHEEERKPDSEES